MVSPSRNQLILKSPRPSASAIVLVSKLSTCPSIASPLSVTLPVGRSFLFDMALVLAEVTVSEVPCWSVYVTVTEIFLPTSVSPSVRIVLVSPEIAVSSLIH